MVVDLVKNLKRRGVTLAVDHDGRLTVEPKSRLSRDEIDQLRQHRDEVRAFVTGAPAVTTNTRRKPAAMVSSGDVPSGGTPDNSSGAPSSDPIDTGAFSSAVPTLAPQGTQLASTGANGLYGISGPSGWSDDGDLADARALLGDHRRVDFYD